MAVRGIESLAGWKCYSDNREWRRSGRGNSEAPTAVRIEAWGVGSSTSTLGLGFAGLYNQRFDVGDSKPRTEPREDRGEAEWGSGAPVARRLRRRRRVVFPSDAHPGRVVSGREEEGCGRNGE
uniref:DUF834 domain-containing protein n=1 Tax=Oryza meridionalis TaxID=40149 RepID=A0A0E0CCV3_9ORYZ